MSAIRVMSTCGVIYIHEDPINGEGEVFVKNASAFLNTAFGHLWQNQYYHPLLMCFFNDHTFLPCCLFNNIHELSVHLSVTNPGAFKKKLQLHVAVLPLDQDMRQGLAWYRVSPCHSAFLSKLFAGHHTAALPDSHEVLHMSPCPWHFHGFHDHGSSVQLHSLDGQFVTFFFSRL